MDLSLDQCLGQCLIIDEVNNGYCLDEQREQYACLAAGGYTCVSGYPQPEATCISELTALSQCQQLAPCRMFCEQVGGECAPEHFGQSHQRARVPHRRATGRPAQDRPETG